MADTTRRHTVKKTTVELDMAEVETAKKILGTRTTRDTIHTALRTVNRRAALARAAALIERGAFEVVEPEELDVLRSARLED